MVGMLLVLVCMLCCVMFIEYHIWDFDFDPSGISLAIIILEMLVVLVVCASAVAGKRYDNGLQLHISGYLSLPYFQRILPKNSCPLRDSIRACSNTFLPWVSYKMWTSAGPAS